jgi:hypothetical protein
LLAGVQIVRLGIDRMRFGPLPETSDRHLSRPADEEEGVPMGLMDKLTEGAERAAKEAEKAFDKGKTKVGELQIEMQMDGLARKLGYLVFDFYRGRQVDQAYRQRILDDMSRLEDQLLRTRAQAAAKAQSEATDETVAAEPTPDSGDAQAAGEAGAAADDAPAWDVTGGSSSEADGRPESDTRSEPDAGAAPADEAPSADDTTRADGDSSTVL